MKHALPRHRHLLRAGRPFLMPVSKRCLKNMCGLGACVEAAT
ncbi:MAG: hypothetical protein Q8J60_03145 [Thiobacillus sp.]|nr:hypothetical protein [Thiobacillus sp.]